MARRLATPDSLRESPGGVQGRRLVFSTGQVEWQWMTPTSEAYCGRTRRGRQGWRRRPDVPRNVYTGACHDSSPSSSASVRSRRCPGFVHPPRGRPSRAQNYPTRSHRAQHGGKRLARGTSRCPTQRLRPRSDDHRRRRLEAWPRLGCQPVRAGTLVAGCRL